MVFIIYLTVKKKIIANFFLIWFKIDENDDNGDGKLNIEEFTQMIKAFFP